ncbi:hypothetical protein JX265_008368 [Neoarthrinium moseri]|uniref:Uncharacterized protein n=1 Tax=Neoarthrinium moseri TaxID=1658444 RepID=A0A9P9WI38_9PEZI|nr:hypothetical protein JX266_008840 [Neoarthrinium moseri]KAI1864644.1 hypothetical protein JX265_008368 [Neoarthrinium moseri]
MVSKSLITALIAAPLVLAGPIVRDGLDTTPSQVTPQYGEYNSLADHSASAARALARIADFDVKRSAEKLAEEGRQKGKKTDGKKHDGGGHKKEDKKKAGARAEEKHDDVGSMLGSNARHLLTERMTDVASQAKKKDGEDKNKQGEEKKGDGSADHKTTDTGKDGQHGNDKHSHAE